MTARKLPKHDSFEGIAQEHRKLRELLRHVDATVADGESAAQRLCEILGDLSDELKVHFTNEERDGYFADIVERAPHFHEKIELLKQQHVEFLVAVRELIDLSGDSMSTADGRAQFDSGYRQFIDRLLAHEAAENELLQEAYTRDIGSND